MSVLVSAVTEVEFLVAGRSRSRESAGAVAQTSGCHPSANDLRQVEATVGVVENRQLARIIHPVAKEKNRKPACRSICES
jgi:hypothetical protein